jgi:hypothetical protein
MSRIDTSPTPPLFAAETEFAALQAGLREQFERYFPDPLAPKTVVIVPSLTLDAEMLTKLPGHIHYEERLLCMLLLLRMPRTHVVYVSSMPIDEVIIDYYLHLLPGITGHHARRRLTLLACHDASNRPLTQKVLERPRLLAQIRASVPAGHVAHLCGFNITELEQDLAVQLGIPLYGCPATLAHWGTKTGSRELFRRIGLAMPDGFERLRDEHDICRALQALQRRNPGLRRAVVKLNDGFSGDGNAIVYFGEYGARFGPDELRRSLHCVAADMNFELFMEKFNEMGGVVEAFIEGAPKVSPSVQCRINPVDEVEVISTHDQVLSGEAQQVYLGARFPANAAYAQEIGALGHRVATALQPLGVLGRFGVDFVSVYRAEQNAWEHLALEINLRKGGTTHPYLMLQFLTNGRYNAATGHYEMPDGEPRCYLATDGLHHEAYKMLRPDDLLDIAMCHNLHYDATLQEGVMFHLLGALAQHGKLGVVCIGRTPERAEEYYQRTVEVLDRETQG